jgi:hypothetical protein
LDFATARPWLRGFAFGERIAMKSLASAEVLSETRERLLQACPGDRARWGRMTATQMVRHLTCAYEVALGERAAVQVKGLPPVVVKWVALRSGLRWPKNMATTPELARAIKETPKNQFGDLVGGTIEKMEAVASGAAWQHSHPMFGRMTAADWMRWGYLHADHHLRQFGR